RPSTWAWASSLSQTAAVRREATEKTARLQTVFVLDFGSQFSQLIARRVREANVYCELVPGTTPWSELEKRNPSGLILSGGPASVYDAGAPQVHPEALRSGVPVLGIQFHPEVVHTPSGREVLRNFLFGVCKCTPTWTPGSFIAEATESIRAQVGGGRVICALSGGVDSAVAATLVHRAVGDQLTCVFVNNGLLRKEEPERVLEVMHGHLHMNIRYIDATERFLAALSGVVDPEQKRRIVGREFISVFEAEATKLGH